jgi:hypothetical protein
MSFSEVSDEMAHVASSNLRHDLLNAQIRFFQQLASPLNADSLLIPKQRRTGFILE